MIYTLVIRIIAAGIRISTPLLLGSLGEMLIERSGILNLGIEGTMVLGALSGFAVSYYTHNVLLGVIAAIFSGAVCGLAMGLLTINLKIEQHVAGLAVTGIASGVAYFIYARAFGNFDVAPKIDLMKTANVNGTNVLGTLIEQTPLTFIAFLLVPLLFFVLFKRPFGLRLRAVGEYPEAADSVGVNVYKMRYTTLILGSVLIGLGGAFLPISQVGVFMHGMVSGRGWICLALVLFGRWNPIGVMSGALLFGLLEAAQLRLQTLGVINAPYQLFQAIPFIVTIMLLILLGEKTEYPGAYGKNYDRGGA